MPNDRKKQERVTRRSGTGFGRYGNDVGRSREERYDAEERADMRGRDAYDEYAYFDRSRSHDEYRDRQRDAYRDERREDRRAEHREDYRDERREDRRAEHREDYRDERYDHRREDRRDDYRDDYHHDHRDERRGSRREERENERRDERSTRRKSNAGARTTRRGPNPDRTVHQLVPYALLCLAPFAAVSFILRDIYGLGGSTGAFGNFLADFLCGLFGTAAYFAPAFMLVLALRWRRLVTSGLLTRKLLLSTAFVLLLSGIIHVFQEGPETRGVLDTAARSLYDTGVIRAGGGFFGGLAGEWLGYVLRLPGTIILGIPLLLIVAIYLVGLTPHGVWNMIAARVRLIREKREERRRALFDGEETPRARIKESASSENRGRAAAHAEAANWRQPRPIEPIRLDEDEEHFVFSDEEDEPLRPTPARADRSRGESIAPMSDFRVFDDEPDEVPATSRSAATAPDPVSVLREIPEEEGTPVEQSTDGEIYAPFALPVRPFPKREERKTDSTLSPFHWEEAQSRPTPEAPASEEREEEMLGTFARRPAEQPSTAPASTAAPQPAPAARDEETRTVAFDLSALMPDTLSAPTTANEARGEVVSPFAFAPDEEEEPIAGEAAVAHAAVVSPFAPIEQEWEDTTLDDADPYGDDELEQTLAEDKEEFEEIEEDEGEEEEEEEDDAPIFVAPERPAAPRFEPKRPTPVAVKAERVDPQPPPEPAPVMREYTYPRVDLLSEDTNRKGADYSAETAEKIEVLRQTLADFNIRVKEHVDCSRGPTITRYELRPEAGVSVRSVINRIDDISLNMAAPVRIEAPIPGKPAIGIEVPNAVRETVFMRTMLESEAFKNSKKPLDVPLGLGIGGDVQMCNLAAMPHLLVAGTTGSGKSVCINAILLGLMYKTSPRDLRLILVDPKQVEFAPYEHVPHLYMPIVTDMQRAAGALACAVQEMDRRYSLIRDVGVRDIDSYNEAVKNDPEREHLPRIVIVIDEFAELKMGCNNNDVENFTCRIAQKARAAGIHLIIGTQRPSVDVITGKLKNNIPSRIAFTVKQQVDSRTILDMNGAESLIGRGDMLYMPTGSPKPARVQGVYVSDSELERVVEYVRKHNDPVQYNRAFMDQIEAEMARAANTGKKDDYDDVEGGEDGEDAKFIEAVELAVSTQKVATSLLQRRLGVGYGRAAKIIDRMEELGLVSPADGNKPRKLLPAAQGFLDHIRNGEDIDEEYDEDYN